MHAKGAIGRGVGSDRCGTRTADLKLYDTTVSGNSAASGGGRYASRTASPLTNSTLCGNTATQGGGIDVNSDTLTLTNCTLTTNRASTGSRGVIAAIGGALLNNSLIRWGHRWGQLRRWGLGGVRFGKRFKRLPDLTELMRRNE